MFLFKYLRGDKDVFTTLLIRVAAGIAGALPALIALAWLDRAAYGHAMANYAWALLISGPVARFISHGYLRELLSNSKQLNQPPRGTIYIHLYLMVCIPPICIVAFFGERWIDASFIIVNLVLVAFFRVQESWFIARHRQTAAILLFYFMPPLLHAALILSVKSIVAVDQFWLVATSQVIGHSIAMAASVLIQSPEGRRFLLPRPPRTLFAWLAEFRAIKQFSASGALLSATEQMPVIFLNAFGFPALVPIFEVARKLASVPEVLSHALNMHLMPKLISHAGSSQWGEFRRVLKLFIVASGGLSSRYIAAVFLGLYAVSVLYPHALQIDLVVFAILFSAALVTSFACPLGCALTVLHGDIWWTVAGGASLVTQFSVSLFAMSGIGAIAIPLSVLAQVVMLYVVTGAAAMLLLLKRERVELCNNRTSSLMAAE